jgi:hypothetical protein
MKLKKKIYLFVNSTTQSCPNKIAVYCSVCLCYYSILFYSIVLLHLAVLVQLWDVLQCSDCSVLCQIPCNMLSVLQCFTSVSSPYCRVWLKLVVLQCSTALYCSGLPVMAVLRGLAEVLQSSVLAVQYCSKRIVRLLFGFYLCTCCSLECQSYIL